MGTGGSFGVKQPGCEADHSHSSNAEIKNVGAMTLPYLYMSLDGGELSALQCGHLDMVAKKSP
jgi:hypothetical protein